MAPSHSLTVERNYKMTTPRIYVACLSSYNNGILHGRWIESNSDPDQIQEDINAMLKASPMGDAEEWAIHDFEYFYGYNPSWHLPEKIYEVATFIEEHGKVGAELLEMYSDIDEAREVIEYHYLGCYENLSDYAEELTSQSCEIPSCLVYYIDYEAMARDMEINGEFYSIQTAYDEHHLFMN